MKKVLLGSVLLVTVWVLMLTTWAVVSYDTGLPGPRTTVTAMFDSGARAAGAVDLPPPLSFPQKLAVRQFQMSGRFASAVLGVPEKIGTSLAARCADSRHRGVVAVGEVVPQLRTITPVIAAGLPAPPRAVVALPRRIEIRDRIGTRVRLRVVRPR